MPSAGDSRIGLAGREDGAVECESVDDGEAVDTGDVVEARLTHERDALIDKGADEALGRPS